MSYYWLGLFLCLPFILVTFLSQSHKNTNELDSKYLSATLPFPIECLDSSNIGRMVTDTFISLLFKYSDNATVSRFQWDFLG